MYLPLASVKVFVMNVAFGLHPENRSTRTLGMPGSLASWQPLPFKSFQTKSPMLPVHGFAALLAEKLKVPPKVLKVAMKLPGVGANPGPVMMPEPIRVIVIGSRSVCANEERVIENPATDQIGPTGGTAGLTSNGDAMVVTDVIGTEMKSPDVCTTIVGPMSALEPK